MEKAYYDRFKMMCMVTEEGILFSNSLRDVYYPYGCIDSLNLSLLGVLQVVSRAHVCCFTASREDKAEIKALVKQAKAAMKQAAPAEPVVLEQDTLGLDPRTSPDLQLQQLKAMFVQGVISKEVYDLKKRLLKM